MIGRVFGQFEVIEKIGSGGMGTVYRARDRRLGRDVALKVLPAGASPDGVARFEREARVIAALNHPNIVHVYSVDEVDGVHFITMELVRGRQLDAVVPDEGLPLERIVEIGVAISDALAAAHREGVIHRDLKPANVMVDADDRVRVLDFGLAKVVRPASGNEATTATSITHEGVAVGTYPYMSPEQLSGREATSLSDVFALGAVLYEIACGRRAFDGVLRDPPPPVSSARPEAPYDLQRIIGRCLNANPNRRFQTADDVRNELDELARLISHESDSARPAADTARGNRIAEREFVLTADAVRRLDERHPSMIGGRMTWLENDVESDVLVFFIHGMGQDQRRFADTLRRLPVRGVAPTLYGWDARAHLRIPLSVEDHSRLLRLLFRERAGQLRPRRVLLVGFSSGGDHVCRMLCSNDGAGIHVDGALIMGGNVDLSSCFYSRVCAELDPEDPATMLTQIKQIGEGMTSLRDWLTLQKYLVDSFLKFGTDVHTIKRYGAEIVEPFLSRGEDQFIDWYRTVTARVPVARFVCTQEDFAALDRILARHLDENVLGDDYREESIVREDTSHVAISHADRIVHHALRLLETIKNRAGDAPRDHSDR